RSLVENHLYIRYIISSGSRQVELSENFLSFGLHSKLKRLVAGCDVSWVQEDQAMLSRMNNRIAEIRSTHGPQLKSYYERVGSTNPQNWTGQSLDRIVKSTCENEGGNQEAANVYNTDHRLFSAYVHSDSSEMIDKYDL